MTRRFTLIKVILVVLLLFVMMMIMMLFLLLLVVVVLLEVFVVVLRYTLTRARRPTARLSNFIFSYLSRFASTRTMARHNCAHSCRRFFAKNNELKRAIMCFACNVFRNIRWDSCRGVFRVLSCVSVRLYSCSAEFVLRSSTSVPQCAWTRRRAEPCRGVL